MSTADGGGGASGLATRRRARGVGRTDGVVADERPAVSRFVFFGFLVVWFFVVFRFFGFFGFLVFRFFWFFGCLFFLALSIDLLTVHVHPLSRLRETQEELARCHSQYDA